MKRYLPFILVLLFASCDIINPAEDTPAFIYIEDFTIATTSSQGSHSSKITDAWVWVGSENQGVYPLPAHIPVLQSGTQTIFIEAGIKTNGISASRESYPFYTTHEQEIDLNPNETDTVRPDISYTVNEIPFIEDFEKGNALHIFSDSINHSIDNEFTDTLENQMGNYFGKIAIDGDAYEVFECGTDDLNLPTDKPVYLEMDYKCNTTMVVGLYANNNSQVEKNAIIYLNPKTQWNKTYIFLSEYLVSYNNANSYKLFFGMIRDTSQTQSEMYLDNIKIVYEE
ncbi:MAG: hypothetical protein H8D62_02335 [Bacteroidetes bacterium]|nr:hypothetical protein [Bacteroidota bacterium]